MHAPLITRYRFGRFVGEPTAWTGQSVGELCHEASLRADEVAGYPEDQVFALFGRLAEYWRENSARARVLERVPTEIGFSPEMVSLALDEIPRLFDPAALRARSKLELRGIPRQYAHRFDPATGTAFRWQPLGTVGHILSGNVFLVAATAMIHGFLTGNVSIFKTSRNESSFLPLLLRSLQECDPHGVLAGSVATLDVGSENHEAIAALKNGVDGLAVWGGEQAIRAYRNDLPARVRVVPFGPRLSIAAVTRQALKTGGVEAVASRLAFECAIWDQHACTAPQVCFVESEDSARGLAKELANALTRLQERLPAGEVDLDTACDIQKLRSIYAVAETRDEAQLHTAREGLDWTVILDRFNAELEPSPLHRTLRIVPVESFECLRGVLTPLRGVIQTVGLAAAGSERMALSALFQASGAVRVVPLGTMAQAAADEPHDGAFDLPQLLNLTTVVLDETTRPLGPTELLPDDERRALIDSRLRDVLGAAARNPAFDERYRSDAVQTVAELPKLPVLDRVQTARATSPIEFPDAWQSVNGGYVTRSGGSTGEPSFTVFDGPDWDALVECGAEMFRAAGLRSGDRVANCMAAGDLYGSFVSFDHVNARVGATSFAFADKLSVQGFLRAWREYGVNAVEGIPSSLVPFLRRAKEAEPKLHLETVLYAGSPMSRVDFEWLQTALASRRVSSVIGATDGGPIAFQCEHMDGTRLHHLVDHYAWVEIVDASGTPVSEGEAGDVLITCLRKASYPLIRYRIGDRARLLRSPCACGRKSRVIEHLGRSDELLAVGVMKLDMNAVEEAAGRCGASAMQFYLGNVESRDFVVLRVESAPELPAEQMRETILDAMPGFREIVESGKLGRFDVELWKPGALPRNPRTGKILRVIDER